MMRGFMTCTMLGVALLAGCVSVNEGNLIVRGQAVDPAAAPYEACLLDTRDVRGGIIDRRRVSGTFHEAIVVAPGEAEYSFALSCAGADETYQSPRFRVEPSEPVDLGHITLKRP
jgi:hypothetical protein